MIDNSRQILQSGKANRHIQRTVGRKIATRQSQRIGRIIHSFYSGSESQRLWKFQFKFPHTQILKFLQRCLIRKFQTKRQIRPYRLDIHHGERHNFFRNICRRLNAQFVQNIFRHEKISRTRRWRIRCRQINDFRICRQVVHRNAFNFISFYV